MSFIYRRAQVEGRKGTVSIDNQLATFAGKLWHKKSQRFWSGYGSGGDRSSDLRDRPSCCCAAPAKMKTKAENPICQISSDKIFVSCRLQKRYALKRVFAKAKKIYL